MTRYLCCSTCNAGDVYYVRDLLAGDAVFPRNNAGRPPAPPPTARPLKVGSLIPWRAGALLLAAAGAVMTVYCITEPLPVEVLIAVATFVLYTAITTLVGNCLYELACRRRVERWLETPDLRFTLRDAVLAIRFFPPPADDKLSFIGALLVLFVLCWISVVMALTIGRSFSLSDENQIFLCIGLMTPSTLSIIPMQKLAKARLNRRKRQWQHRVAPMMHLVQAAGLEEELKPAAYRRLRRTLDCSDEKIARMANLPIVGQLFVPFLMLLGLKEIVTKVAEVHLLDPCTISAVPDNEIVCLNCLDLLLSCRS